MKWERGSIGNHDFEVLVFELPSKYGIENGRISKLTIRLNGVIRANYDRGWDIYPSGKADKVYKEILKKFN